MATMSPASAGSPMGGPATAALPGRRSITARVHDVLHERSTLGPALVLALAVLVFTLADARITYGSILLLGLVAVMAYVLGHTAWGRHVYATGDDGEAARLAGV